MKYTLKAKRKFLTLRLCLRNSVGDNVATQESSSVAAPRNAGFNKGDSDCRAIQIRTASVWRFVGRRGGAVYVVFTGERIEGMGGCGSERQPAQLWVCCGTLCNGVLGQRRVGMSVGITGDRIVFVLSQN
jgi:hypothetical protein